MTKDVFFYGLSVVIGVGLIVIAVTTPGLQIFEALGGGLILGYFLPALKEELK